MKPSLLSILRLLFLKPRTLRDCLRWGLNNHGGRIGQHYPSRQGLEVVEIDEGARFEVFWKKMKHGKGPSVSLFVYEEEILRVDCFGEGAGHLHAAVFNPLKGEDRLFLSEDTVAAQIERARFELLRNLPYYLCRVSDSRIRDYEIEAASLEPAVERAVELMRGFAESS